LRVVAEEQLGNALASVRRSPARVVAGGNFGTPRHALSVLDRTVESYRLFMLNAQGSLPARPGVVHETPFLGPGMRHLAGVEYLPMRLSLVPLLFREQRPPDVVLVQTSLPRHGQVSLGIEVNILPAAIEAARATGGLVIAQLNSQMPHTLGDAELDTDLFDLAIESDELLPGPREAAPGRVTDSIAERVSSLVEDGATLQTGIGTIPDATLAALGSRRGLGVWSEMVSDGVMNLEREGALDTMRPVAASFFGGSEELYSWIDGNPRVLALRTETVNDPSAIAANPSMTSINTALQVDLRAQANASYVRGLIYSGFGGQTDFTVGALHSTGGQAIIALSSWHEKSRTSTLVGALDVPVTSFQHSFVVTDHGCAPIFGRSQREQARALIEMAAHPDARPALWEEAAALGLAGSPTGAGAAPAAAAT
jgi:acyl-CoA hydrolase